MQELQEVVNNVLIDKASGLDFLPSKYLKELCEDICLNLLAFFQTVLYLGLPTKTFNRCMVVLIGKLGVRKF